MTELISFKEKIVDIFLIITQIMYRFDLGKELNVENFEKNGYNISIYTVQCAEILDNLFRYSCVGDTMGVVDQSFQYVGCYLEYTIYT